VTSCGWEQSISSTGAGFICTSTPTLGGISASTVRGHAFALAAGDYRLHAATGDAIDDLRLQRQYDDPTFDQLSVINTFVGGKSVVP